MGGIHKFTVGYSAQWWRLVDVEKLENGNLWVNRDFWETHTQCNQTWCEG